MPDWFDIGLVVTGGAAAVALFVGGKCHLSHFTAMAWVAAMAIGFALPKAAMPGAWAVVDAALALACLVPVTRSHCRAARIIGLISMAMICLHFIYAGTRGGMAWWVYASVLNAGFCLQCFVAAGGWGVVERVFDRVRSRFVAGHPRAQFQQRAGDE